MEDGNRAVLYLRLSITGLFMGSMLAFVFCALTMRAVGRAAGAMVEEVRRQFREIKGIMDGSGQPDATIENALCPSP